MPVSLRGLETTFQQLHEECRLHAHRRENLAAEVSVLRCNFLVNLQPTLLTLCLGC